MLTVISPATDQQSLVERFYGRPGPGVPSEKQLRYLLRLAGERQVDSLGNDAEERTENIAAKLEARPAGREVSTWIDYLLKQPETTEAAVARQQREQQQRELVGIGVYELPDGRIYVVKPNREKTRVYAMRLVESPDRLNEADEQVPFDMEYERGAIYELADGHRMTTDRAKHFLIRYGKCIVCRTKLTAAKSVERGIGPICARYFA